MPIRKLYIKDPGNLDKINNYDLLEKVYSEGKFFKKKPVDHIPVLNVYIITDGHDIVGLETKSGEQIIYGIANVLNNRIIPESKSQALFESRYSGHSIVKKNFFVESEKPMEKTLLPMDSNIAIKIKDSVIIPRVLFINSESPVNFISKIKDNELRIFSISDILEDFDATIDQTFTYNPKAKWDSLSVLLIGYMILGSIYVPNKPRTSFPEF